MRSSSVASRTLLRSSPTRLPPSLGAGRPARCFLSLLQTFTFRPHGSAFTVCF